LEEDHVLGKGALQGRVGHGIAAVLDDKGFALQALDEGLGANEEVDGTHDFRESRDGKQESSRARRSWSCWGRENMA
jgi:hypothetical protein